MHTFVECGKKISCYCVSKVNIQLEKKHNAVLVEGKDVRALFLTEKVKNPEDLFKLPINDVDIIFAIPEKLDLSSAEERLKWSRMSEKMFPENVLVAFSAGEYRVKDFHIRGVQDGTSLQFVIESSEGMVGLISGKPSENFIKKYAPLDIIIGEDLALADSQFDLEPFYVVLTNLRPEYMQQTGITEIKATDKVNVKKIDASARESTVDMAVIHLK